MVFVLLPNFGYSQSNIDANDHKLSAVWSRHILQLDLYRHYGKGVTVAGPAIIKKTLFIE